jgi:hypothetical protein
MTHGQPSSQPDQPPPVRAVRATIQLLKHAPTEAIAPVLLQSPLFQKKARTHWTIRHSQRLKAVRSKMAADQAFKGEAEALCVAMLDGKAADGEVAGVEDSDLP